MTDPQATRNGASDIAAASEALADRLPAPLSSLAVLAYNYWWSWTPDGADIFRTIDPDHWERCGHNPVRLLREVKWARLEQLADTVPFVGRVNALEERLEAAMSRRSKPLGSVSGTTAYLSAEFGIHQSLPFYAGGLGVLAGDFLKEASDSALNVAGLGLFYSQGSFHQRLDSSGWQHEFWLRTDSDHLPAAVVTNPDGSPLTVSVSIRGRAVSLRIWRVDVGSVPLYLLDADHPGNVPADRWITSRLYVGDRELRLAQYALLGIGGVRALRAMGLRPGAFHLNEGHAALALLELLRERLVSGRNLHEAQEDILALTRFTTHTPVAAGNESFSADQLRMVLPDLDSEMGIEWHTLIAMGRVRPEDPGEAFGLTPLALRCTGNANAVSRLHGSTSRAMWHGIWPHLAPDDVPINHVTNGVHRPTWMSPEMSTLLSRYVPQWDESPFAEGSWDAILHVPDEELWRVRNAQRREFAAFVRQRSVTDRLGRGQDVRYAEEASQTWSDDALTIGFARRIATYKRLYLITHDPARGVRLLSGVRPSQLAIAGRAHPSDEDAKRTVQRIFELSGMRDVGAHVAFLEDHDITMAARLVQGCDLWVNLPRVPQEASGTSGMKSVLNGGLQLSVLDGWWAEAYQPGTGWAIDSDPKQSWEEQDRSDAEALFNLLEFEVLPLFYDRDASGIPRGWVRMMKTSLAAHGPRFTATRMLHDYAALANDTV